MSAQWLSSIPEAVEQLAVGRQDLQQSQLAVFIKLALSPRPQFESKQAQIELIGLIRAELLHFAKLVQAELTILIRLAQLAQLVELAQLVLLLEFVLLATFTGQVTPLEAVGTSRLYCQLLLQPNQVLL